MDAAVKVNPIKRWATIIAWHFSDKNTVVGAPGRYWISRNGLGYSGINRWGQPQYSRHPDHWKLYGSAAWAQRDIDWIPDNNLTIEPIGSVVRQP